MGIAFAARAKVTPRSEYNKRLLVSVWKRKQIYQV